MTQKLSGEPLAISEHWRQVFHELPHFAGEGSFSLLVEQRSRSEPASDNEPSRLGQLDVCQVPDRAGRRQVSGNVFDPFAERI